MSSNVPPERLVAGLRCGEVLADLSRYLDGELDARQRGALEAHVRGCEWCERFGNEMGAVVSGLKRALAEPERLDDAVVSRLNERLARDAR
ncbi:MAG: zf-HC2 domain-containing protein [Deltaproteobacteria bacterium]|nr:zf-HC2 domain-containing protein [Deltaproteobacteria bacterium]